MRIETGSWTSDDATVRRQEMFRRVDQDSDGKLTKDELKAGAPDRLRENSAALEELFARLDANGDDAVEQAEFQASMNDHPGPRRAGPPAGEAASKIFERADSDRDGLLVRADLDAAGRTPPAEALDALFAEADEDGDGQISLDDLTTALEALRPEAPTYGSDGSRAPAPSSRFSAIA